MPHREETGRKHWLDLSDAAEYLGVHFTTLRRWADAGDVPCIRTPGGRRRFEEKDLQLFLASLRQHNTAAALVPLETLSLDAAWQHLQAHGERHQNMLAQFGEEQRNLFRYSGQRLLGLLIQYGSRVDSGEMFLEQAIKMAADYGAVCRQAGLTVSDTVKTFLFFGHSMMDAVQRAGATSASYDEQSSQLYTRMNDFMDAILLATVEAYAGSSSHLETR